MKSKTSKEAADSMRDHVKTLQDQVYAIVYNAGLNGKTCEEVTIELNRKSSSVSARFNYLKNANLFTETEGRRKTTSNRNAAVYVASCLLPTDKKQLELF